MKLQKYSPCETVDEFYQSSVGMEVDSSGEFISVQDAQILIDGIKELRTQLNKSLNIMPQSTNGVMTQEYLKKKLDVENISL